MEKHPVHLKNPEFQTSPEVQRAVEREEDRAIVENKKFRASGQAGPLLRKKVPNDPAERIEAYMDRLENIFLNPDSKKRDRNLEMFRDKIYDALIIKRENFPESYFELQKRIARERGHGDVEISDETRERMVDTAIKDQKTSLDGWMNYLSEEDVAYPTWFKFYVWNQVIKLSQFDKQLGNFKARTESTVGRFPDIHRAALAKILDLYKNYPQTHRDIEVQAQPLRAKRNQLKIKKRTAPNEEEVSRINAEIDTIDQEISKISEPLVNFNKKFPDLYAEIIAKGLASKIENKDETRGKWVRYEENNPDAAEQLWRSVEGKTGAAGWCVEGKETAHTYNEVGDFHVYYTYDENDNPTQPRLAIQMNGNQIGQIRGLLVHQDVEPVMQEVLDSKLALFGTEADSYRKKSLDMRMLTVLDAKRKKVQPFTKDDLVFLYEINSTIEGFGYERDPRIAQLRSERNLDEDMLTLFDCTKEQIAHVPNEINANTMAYVGPLEPGIFQRLPEHLEHVYTSFPKKKIRREKVEIGGKTAEQLISELEAAGVNIYDHVKYMMRSSDFVAGINRENATLVQLSLADMGFDPGATTGQIYARAQELGLDLWPPDAGPNYRLKYQKQPLNELVHIGMKQFRLSSGLSSVFLLGRNEGGLYLSNASAFPDDYWSPPHEFAFRQPQVI